MDGRLQHLLAGAFLCGLVGCSSFGDKTPKMPKPTGEPPFVMNNQTIIDDRTSRKDGPMKVETMITVANVRVQASIDENKSTQQREELANSARLLYEAALKREPKNLDAMRGMARMYAVLADKEKCVEWYQRAGKAHPNNAEVWYEMGKALGSHFKDKDGALSGLHAAAKLAPENRAYRTELGFTLAWCNRYDEAYAWLSRVMPEAKARYNLAGIAEHNGDTAQARMQLANALKADPTHQQSKQMLAALNGMRDAGDSPIRNASHEQSSSKFDRSIPVESMMPHRSNPRVNSQE